MDDSSDLFPIGMRILAVDHDPTCLQVLETLLRTYQYHVTTTNQAITALAMLQENTDKFDLVIIDVHIPDMDGFKLLELVGLEMNLPVIMLSACGDTKLLMKGISHGACDFLLKPVRLEELKNIWQNVIRRENSGLVWSVELHRKFVTAVNHLGIDKSVPKKVLHMMNVENITRENVASHLQKYRLYLKRISCIANHKGTSMVPALGSADQSYLRMDGSEHFHGNAFRSFSPSGIISNLNPVNQNILQSMPMSIGFDYLQNNNDVISVQNLNTKFCDSLQMKPDGFAELTECSSSRQPCVDIVSQQQISNNLSSLEYMASSMMEQVITYVKINDCFSIDDDYAGCVGWEAWLKLLCW